MAMKRLVVLAAAAIALGPTGAQAQEKLKIGIIATLSGPPAVLGQQLRNGFNLAVKTLDGKLGGREVEVIVADDELKPDLAITKVKALVERDKVEFVVGPIFSNVLAAIIKPATEGGAILISPNAGTSNFAGKECNPNFFVTSYQNDQVFAVSGKHAQDSGIKKVFLMAPNYQAGKDALAGFKAFVNGKLDDRAALRAALMKADFKSLRGNFKFNTNHYPIQDFYLVKVGKRADGKFETQIVKKIFENYADPHAKDCPMK